jgi:hypothetical protein
MRHDALLGYAFPSRHFGCKLQPGRAKRQVIGSRCELQAVHAMGNALDEALIAEEAVECRPRNTRMVGLATRDDAPLVGGEGTEPTEGRRP